MILIDHETKIDLLNNEAIAKTIINLLHERPEHPVTIGVHGDWGAGKSSVLEMIEDGFANQERVLCLKFNGWRFQGFEDAKIALIEGIVTGLIEKRPALKKVANTAKDIFKSIDWLKVARKAGGLAVTAFTGLPTPDQISSVMNALEGLASNPEQLITKENLSSTLEEIKSVLKPSESKNIPEEVEEFRRAFDNLLKDAEIEQLVVLIDDLDRCLPDTAIETLEAIRLFVFTARTAFIVAADEAMIEYAVRKHFPELPDTTGPRDYARNYLEKLIQIPFRIPALGETETRIYVTLLLTGAELGEDNDSYAKLIAEARTRLKRPWQNAALDLATIKQVLGDDAHKVNNALILSDQIGPILASGTKGNPRQIKRFLNTLLLRQLTADARGFGDEITLPILAKLMLAERFIPSLFGQIASLAVIHPDGFCLELAILEAKLSSEIGTFIPSESANTENPPDEIDKQPNENISQSTQSSLLAEWEASPAIVNWAHVTPALGNVDLRPYLFVTKDRKDYFGAASTLGKLASVAEKLFGPKLSVQGMEVELKQLAQPEADKLFEALRTKIISTGNFTTKPSGVDGLVVLIKAHPHLQYQLLDFLQTLPSDQCGSWIVSGWESVVKEESAKKRLTQLLRQWSEQTGNKVLHVAAKAVSKPSREIR